MHEKLKKTINKNLVNHRKRERKVQAFFICIHATI